MMKRGKLFISCSALTLSASGMDTIKLAFALPAHLSSYQTLHFAGFTTIWLGLTLREKWYDPESIVSQLLHKSTQEEFLRDYRMRFVINALQSIYCGVFVFLNLTDLKRNYMPLTSVLMRKAGSSFIACAAGFNLFCAVYLCFSYGRSAYRALSIGSPA